MPKEFEEEPIEQPQPRPEVPPLSRRGRQSIQGVSSAPEAAADDAALPDAKVPANDFKNPPEPVTEDLKPERPAYKNLDKTELSRLVQAASENPADGSLERNNSQLYRNMEVFYGPHPAGYDRHHLIPVDVAQNHPAMQTAARLGYDINNPNNAIYLPDTASLAAQTGEPLHTKETHSYDRVVQAELDDVWTRYEHQRVKTGSSLAMADYLKASDQQTAFLQDIQHVENSIRQKLVSRDLFITESDPNYKPPTDYKKLDKKQPENRIKV